MHQQIAECALRLRAVAAAQQDAHRACAAAHVARIERRARPRRVRCARSSSNCAAARSAAAMPRIHEPGLGGNRRGERLRRVGLALARGRRRRPRDGVPAQSAVAPRAPSVSRRGRALEITACMHAHRRIPSARRARRPTRAPRSPNASRACARAPLARPRCVRERGIDDRRDVHAAHPVSSAKSRRAGRIGTACCATRAVKPAASTRTSQSRAAMALAIAGSSSARQRHRLRILRHVRADAARGALGIAAAQAQQRHLRARASRHSSSAVRAARSSSPRAAASAMRAAGARRPCGPARAAERSSARATPTSVQYVVGEARGATQDPSHARQAQDGAARLRPAA